MTTPQRSSASIGSRRSPFTSAAALGVSLLLVAGACTLGASPAAAAGDPLSATALRTDSLVNPIGLSGDDPGFTWQLRSDARATMQTEYRVIVSSTADAADAGDGDVWDSGWTTSDDSVDVAYAGPDLESASDYHWRVKVRDNHGEESAWSDTASFETGLLAASEWGADWIGEADDAAAVAKWTNYSVELSVSDISGALGVYLRADENLASGYMYQISTANGAKLRPHKKTNGGYNSPPDITIPANFLTGALTSSTPNLFRFDVSGNTITSFVNGHQFDVQTDSSFTRGFVGFRTNGAERGNVHSVKVTTLGASPETLVDTNFAEGDSTFTGATQVGAGTVRFGSPASESVLTSLSTEPVFRKDFTVDKTVKSARLYASALGVYEFRLNGERVGDLELAPGWTDYNKRVQYQTYDVTDQLTEGDNAIGAMLGAGWYSGNLGWFGPNQYGTDPRLLGQLVITYDDGTTETVSTDDSWTTTTGPILSSDLLNGETYNANQWQDGWDEAGFDDSSWLATTDDGDLATARLVPQVDEPVRITQQLTPKSVTQVGTGTWVFDLGQNMVGKVLLKTDGNSGKTVRLRHAEILHQDGSIAPENLRSAKATDYFTPVADGGAQQYTPRFTYHGFRYVEVTGLTGTPTTATVTGLVEGSDLDASSTFESSDPMLNQLQSNIIWGQRGNFFSVPTDTPARDERLGWTGDINVFAPTAAFNMYSEEFLRKWMTDMRDAQHANGAYPEVAPQFCTNKAVHDSCGAGSTGWADAGVTVPFVVWQSYGDLDIIRDNWDSMVDYIDFLDTQAVNNLRPGYGTWGDWLNLNDATPGNVLGSAFYAHSVDLMAQMAAAIGDEDAAADYAAQFETIKAAYQAAFISADGTVTGGSQTAYAISIGMGLVPENLVAKAGAKLADRVAAKGGHLSTGFLGTPYLLPALTQSGQNDVAYSLMMSKTFPSWGYEVSMGATTMWERWDSLLADGTPSDLGMNSFNHYAFGAVGDWMYQNIGGISSTSAGYKHSLIAPNPGGGLTFAKVSHDSVYGTVASDWTLEGNRLALSVDVPANTTATVRIPARNVHEVQEGGSAASGATGISGITMDGSDAVVEVGSGHYDFTTSKVAGQFGAVSDGLAQVSIELDALADGGTLPADAHDAGAALVDDTTDAVATAIAAAGESDETAAATSVHDALARLADLTELVAGYTDESAALAEAVTAVRGELSVLSAGFLSLDATLAATDETFPSGRSSATVALENSGENAVSGTSARLATAGWSVVPSGKPSDAALAAGATHESTFDLRAPATVGDSTIRGTVSYTFHGSVATIPVSASVDIVSPVTPTVSSTATSVAPGASATVTVTLANASETPVSVRLGAPAGSGWRLASGSGSATVPANGSIAVPVIVIAPERVTGGATTLPLALTVAGQKWATVTLPLTVALSLDGPVITPLTDYIDLGNTASEQAHNLTASAQSGTNSEAGRTRRYANRTDPNGYFQFTAKIVANKPFLLQAVETFDREQNKVYDISVNGVKVDQRNYTRTVGGQGLVTYQIPVDDPAVLTSETITVRFANEPSGAFYDPSLSDVWITPAADDVTPPSVALEATGEVGLAGWYTGPVEVTATASDNRSGDVLVEAEVGAADWVTYTGPITVSAEGSTTVSVRSTDAAGVIGGLEELKVGIDSVDPVITYAVTTTGAEQRSVALGATDAASGIDTLRYRLDGGTWTDLAATGESIAVTGAGNHRIDTIAVDAAGNSSSKRTDIAIADELAPVVTAELDSSSVRGWVKAGTKVTLKATDSGDIDTIEYRFAGSDWAEYTGPITLQAGRFTLSYRATDGTGNTSVAASRLLWVDGVAPQTLPSVASSSSGGGHFTVAFTATDDASGVSYTEYSIDGDEWLTYTESISVVGYGSHTIEFYSVDEVGNREATRSISVSVKDVEALVAYEKPVISGSVVVGKSLSATTGTWNTSGLEYSYQWLRNGVDITGATSATYLVDRADIGKRISVRVVAQKTGLVAVSATSSATGTVPKIVTTAAVKAAGSSVKKNSSVALTITVKAGSGTPSGTAAIYVNGSKVKTVTLASGTAKYSVKLTKKGTAKIQVKYAGNSAYASDTSSTVKVTVK